MPEIAEVPLLTLDVERNGDVATVKCHGKLVLGVCDVLTSKVRALIPDTKRIVLDLTDLKQMDSMGLGTIVRLYASAKTGGSCLVLVNMGPRIRQLLGITNLLSVLTDMCEQGVTIRSQLAAGSQLKARNCGCADLSFGVMPPQRKTLSIAMIAMNEEANLPRTLESVKWADEIVIVDSGSQDRTLEIAQSFGARTSYHAFGGHGEQKNVALDLCTSDWILLLDADEALTPELQQEIRDLLANEPKFGAYWIPRLNLYFGKWIRHGGFYPDHKLRLFKRGAARLSEGVGPHSTPQFAGQRGKLRGDMLHYAYPTLGIYLEHMNRYSSEIAQLLHNRGKDSRSLPAFFWNAVLNPAATFVYNYFFRLGFLDGREGLLLHINHSVYIHWKYIKAWRLGQGKE